MTDKLTQNKNKKLQTPAVKEYLKGLKEWQTKINEIDNQIIESKKINDASTPITNTASSKIYDPSVESLRYKELGNDQFKQGRFKEAVDYYTLAIQLDNSNAILFANRAMSYLKLKNYSQVVADCNRSINLDKTYLKSYHRRGQAYKELKKYKEALEDFKTVQSQDPKSKEAENEIKLIKQLLQQQSVAESIIRDDKIKNEDTMKIDKVTEIKQTPINTTEVTKAKVEEIKQDEMKVDSKSHITSPNTPSATVSSPPSLTTSAPSTTSAASKGNSLQERLARLANMKPTLPKQPPRNSFEFEKFYNSIQNDHNLFYNYFKLIEPERLPAILNDVLSPSLFSNIITILEDKYLVNKEYDLIYQILDYLSKMSRLNINLQSLSFMEKESLNTIFNSIIETIGKEKIEALKNKFLN